jgi:hypothetical protein
VGQAILRRVGVKHWIGRNTAMNTIKNIIIAATLSTLSVGYLGAARAAETVKPLQGISFHTDTKDAVAYYLADKGTCKVVLTLTDKIAYAPARSEEAVEPHKSMLHQIDDGNALEFACQADAQAMTINMLATVAAQH